MSRNIAFKYHYFRELQKVYPRFPSMDVFARYCIRDNCNCEVLQRFLNEYSQLKVAGELLPLLIQFYKWIHTDLLFVCTRAEADKITIKQIVERESKRHSETLEDQYVDLFEKMLGNLFILLMKYS